MIVRLASATQNAFLACIDYRRLQGGQRYYEVQHFLKMRQCHRRFSL
jgi:hypothetical protein